MALTQELGDEYHQADQQPGPQVGLCDMQGAAYAELNQQHQGKGQYAIDQCCQQSLGTGFHGWAHSIFSKCLGVPSGTVDGWNQIH